MDNRYFFDTDDDGHWYLVPEAKRDLFLLLLEGNEDEWEQFEDNFAECRIGCHPNSYVFVEPRERNNNA